MPLHLLGYHLRSPCGDSSKRDMERGSFRSLRHEQPTRRSQVSQTQRNEPNQEDQANRRNRPMTISEEERLFSEEIANLIADENYSPFMNQRLNGRNVSPQMNNLAQNVPNNPNINQDIPELNQLN